MMIWCMYNKQMGGCNTVTTRDYKILAKAIAEANSGECSLNQEAYNYGVLVTADRLCDALLVDNHKFNKAKFLAYVDKCRGDRV